jgi:hypothetical protein
MDEVRTALLDAAQRLRSLAKSDELRCRCESLNGTTYHCEPCRALAAADRFETLAHDAPSDDTQKESREIRLPLPILR